MLLHHHINHLCMFYMLHWTDRVNVGEPDEQVTWLQEEKDLSLCSVCVCVLCNHEQTECVCVCVLHNRLSLDLLISSSRFNGTQSELSCDSSLRKLDVRLSHMDMSHFLQNQDQTRLHRPSRLSWGASTETWWTWWSCSSVASWPRLTWVWTQLCLLPVSSSLVN